MASGGSTPPSHLSLSSNYLTSSSSENLQTPNLSLTPVTNITVGNTGGNGSQSFTSLEELLNITGINAPDPRPSSVRGTNDNGVDSLHKMAQAVENAHQGVSDLQPLPKKPRLDSHIQTPQQPNMSLSLPSNIRVQPLNNNLSSTKLQPDVTIASLLHKKQFKHMSVNSTATNLPAVQSVKQVAPMVNPLTQKVVTASEARAENNTTFSSSGGIQSTSKPHSWSQSTLPTQGPPQISAFAPQSTSTTASVAQTSAGLQSTASPVIPSLMQTHTTAPSSFSPKSFLLQLVQLYKHYQNLGDDDGMARVKKQLNVLVSTRQGLTGPQGSSNPLLGALSLLTSPVSATASSSTGIQTTQSNSSTGPHTQGTTVSSLPLGTTTIINSLPNLTQTTQQASVSQSQQESLLPTRITQSSSSAHSLLNSSIQSAMLQPQQRTVTAALPNSEYPPQATPTQRTTLPNSHPQTKSVQKTPQSQRPLVTSATVKTNSVSTMSIGDLSGIGNSSIQQSSTPANLSTTASIAPSQTVTGAMQQEQAIAVQQKAVKQLQTIMASLPVSKRPKTVQEIRDFVHKYSSLINQIQTGTLPDLAAPASSQSTKSLSATPSSTAPSSSILTTSLTGTSLVPTVSVSTVTDKGGSTVKSTGASVGAAMRPIVVPINFGTPSTSLSTQTASTVTTCSSIVTIPRATLSSSAMAQVDQHFQNSLSAVSMKSSLNTGKGLATVPLSLQQSTQSHVTRPVVVDLTQDSESSSSKTGVRTQQSNILSQSLPGLAGTIHAPITTQFKGSPTVSKNPQQSVSSQGVATSAGVSSGIQAGVATPLPPGLTLETLAVLCRLPETELEKLKLPAGLLSAIKVWKDRQPAKKGVNTVSKTSLNNSNRSNIPVLFPPSAMSSSSSGHLSSIATISKTPSSKMKDSIFHNAPPMKVSDAISFASSLHTQDLTSGGAKLSGDAGIQSLKKPYVIPSSIGFPPRSLHAYIPGIGQSNLTTPTAKLHTTSSTPQRPIGSVRHGPQHMTRYRTKVDLERAQKDRIQALTKALQTSEEARIAFRFSAHLEKMHSQLLTPDSATPFNSKQDVLARLLPYHVYAESEPPPAAVEKADAVFESVAQVLLSRSKGLRSRFQQMLAKSDTEGGSEMSSMQMELGRCFLEGEQDRIQQENLEKKQAEQVAADLSMMMKTDGGDTFDSEFSLSDAFFPFLDVDNGIT